MFTDQRYPVRSVLNSCWSKAIGFIAALTLSVAVGCSKQPMPNPAPAEPLVSPSAATPKPTTNDTFTSSVDAAGIPATYQASFAGAQLERIDETRGKHSASASHNTYEFLGARLMKYTGASLSDDASIELEFSPQGAVTVARSQSREVTAEEIGAIRSRAQLLRSLALAERSTRAHRTQ
jgi:hypothetical protein